MTASPIITGIGLVTPLGGTANQTWDALCDGRAILNHARAIGCDGAPGRIVGLAARAAREATADANWTAVDVAAAPLVFGTSKGPVETWLPVGEADKTDGGPYETAGGRRACRASRVVHAFGLSGAAAAVAASLGLRGPRWTLSAACASGLHALIRAALLIRGGEARRVLVVATEASVHPLFLGCFARLGVLPPEGFGCRPLDLHRAGFLMSEAAAAVCVEAADESPPAARRDGRPRVAVERFALGGDATHLTGGAADAGILRHLLARVVDGRPVDLFHAHATGTPLNDAAELAAIESVVAAADHATDARPPHVYSHKGALGHSLGAAGLVSVVLNCLAHRHGLVPPNVQTRDPLPTTRVQIDRGAVRRPVRRSVAAAAGFGGPTAAVSLVTTAGE